MNEVKWPKYSWKKYGEPLHCEQALDGLGNEYITSTLHVIEESGKHSYQHTDKDKYEARVEMWIRRNYIKIVPYDHAPFEGNV